MKGIIVREIEFKDPLTPLNEDDKMPFTTTSLVSAQDLPCGIIDMIRKEFDNDRMVIPVKITIEVGALDGSKNVTDEVMKLARRTLKAVEFTDKNDRGAIGSCGKWCEAPYMMRIPKDPCEVLRRVMYGWSTDIEVIGFLTRAK